jgi:hypothetical protein
MKNRLELMVKYTKKTSDAAMKTKPANRFRSKAFLVFINRGNRPTIRVVASMPIKRAGSLIAWLPQFISAMNMQNRFNNSTIWRHSSAHKWGVRTCESLQADFLVPRTQTVSATIQYAIHRMNRNRARAVSYIGSEILPFQL